MCVVLDFAPQRWRRVLCSQALSGTPSRCSGIGCACAKRGGARAAPQRSTRVREARCRCVLCLTSHLSAGATCCAGGLSAARRVPPVTSCALARSAVGRAALDVGGYWTWRQ
jgi:hypothetical protein